MEATMTSTSGATTTQGNELTRVDGAQTPSVQAPEHRAPHILLYSDDATVREQVRLAVGRRVRAGAPDIVWKEVATATAVVAAADKGGLDLLVLDGEADKAGGMGLCRQLKNEIFRCPPVLVLTGRPQDGWLASWSLADEAVPRPFDAIELQRAIASLIE
jgi:DNA-binding response OmpR family regulator